MPALDPERQTLRSAVRYQPYRSKDQVQSRPGPLVTRKSRPRPDVLHTTATTEWPDGLEEEERLPRRRRATSVPQHQQAAIPRARVRRRFHPLFWLGASLLTALLLWLGASQTMKWGTNEWNAIRYGTPRTFQVDAVVGQGDSPAHPSHFIAINLHGQISVIDFPAGDASRARDFLITTVVGPNSDLDPVTLRFIALSKNGRPDMLVDIGGIQSVLINSGSTFRSPTPAEQQQILNALGTLTVGRLRLRTPAHFF